MVTLIKGLPRVPLLPGAVAVLFLLAVTVASAVLLSRGADNDGGSGGGGDNPPPELIAVRDALPRFPGTVDYSPVAYTGGNVMDAVYYATADPKEIVTYFQQEMTKAGWQDVATPEIKATDPGLGPSWEYIASREKFRVTVTSIRSEKDVSLGTAMIAVRIEKV